MIENIIAASPNQGRIISWKQGLKNLLKTSIVTDRMDVLLDDVLRIEPRVAILDIDLIGLNDVNQIANLKKLCSKTKAIIISGNISEDIEWELVKLGIKGICNYDNSAEIMTQAVSAVLNGELWVKRSLASRLIDELNKLPPRGNSTRGSQALLNKLTQREYDIALHVGNGESNKEIAELCAISERTVKAHLSEVFQKLGISDRINLALLITQTDDQMRNDIDASLSSIDRSFVMGPGINKRM